ncbi:TauD/TfdA family dioxygenase, partial [Streptomyces mirabilis]|uniref:TauD/TfdA family dioxygenase n=1 Tax=Streptomyces mirabilis TaxID=68239 RepID=UPI003D9F8FB0
WSPNQLVLFDNRITQHYAVDNYDGRPRRLHRARRARVPGRPGPRGRTPRHVVSGGP